MVQHAAVMRPSQRADEPVRATKRNNSNTNKNGQRRPSAGWLPKGGAHKRCCATTGRRGWGVVYARPGGRQWPRAIAAARQHAHLQCSRMRARRRSCTRRRPTHTATHHNMQRRAHRTSVPQVTMPHRAHTHTHGRAQRRALRLIAGMGSAGIRRKTASTQTCSAPPAPLCVTC